MQIENGSYDLEVLVFEKGLLKIKGQGRIKLQCYITNYGIMEKDISWESPPSFYNVIHE